MRVKKEDKSVVMATLDFLALTVPNVTLRQVIADSDTQVDPAETLCRTALLAVEKTVAPLRSTVMLTPPDKGTFAPIAEDTIPSSIVITFVTDDARNENAVNAIPEPNCRQSGVDREAALADTEVSEVQETTEAPVPFSRLPNE